MFGVYDLKEVCIDPVVKELNVATLHCIPYVFQNVVVWLFALVGIAAIILIAYSGVRFIFSGGDAKQVESARKTFTFAIAGLILVLLAYVIINLIASITGVGCFFDEEFQFLFFAGCQK